jgi:two-component system NarL family sensor kinase
MWLDFNARTLEHELGDGWVAGIHPGSNLDAFLQVYLEAFHARRPFQLEYRLRCRNGQYRWIVDHGGPFEDTGENFAGYIHACYDITQHKQVEEALDKLSGRLLRLQDEAHRRIAWVHDSTAQQLAIAAINLAKLERDCEGLDPTVANLLSSLAIIDQWNSELRTTSHLLHPPLLDELGLNKALQHYVQKFSERSGIRVMIEARADSERLPQEIEMALFRVAQESLVNIDRHSSSSAATIRLSCDDDRVTLEIKDEGRGLRRILLEHASEATASLGVGIAGMAERLRQLGGRLEIDSGSRGTTVRAMAPLLEAMQPSHRHS